MEPQNKNSRTQASIKPFLANKDTTTDACKTKIEDIKTLVQVFNNIFVRNTILFFLQKLTPIFSDKNIEIK